MVRHDPCIQSDHNIRETTLGHIPIPIFVLRVDLDFDRSPATFAGCCIVPYNIIGSNTSRIFLACPMHKIITRFSEEDKLDISVG